jgi:hypothetical protein
LPPFVFWFAAPLLSASFGYLLWQAVKTRGELLRVLGDAGAIAGVLDGRDWRKAALADRRVQKALRDMTQLSINTPILFRSFEQGMLRIAWAMAALILAIAAVSAVLVNTWLAVPVVIAGGIGLLFPLHPIGARKVSADLTALALSLHLWYEYDAVICESVNLMSSRFERLLAYVKAHFTEY